MRKYLIALVVLISCSAWADWTLIVVDEEGTRHFIDPKTIRKEGSRIKVWELQDFKTAFRGTLSMRFRMEYDCKKEQNKMLSISSHSGGMGTGLVIQSDELHVGWRDIAPQSVNEKISKAVCK